HEYEQLSNKVAHPRALSSLRCPTLIWGAARAVKQTRLMGDRAGKRKLTRPGQRVTERVRSRVSACTRARPKCHPPRQIVIGDDGGRAAFDWALSRLPVFSPSLEPAWPMPFLPPRSRRLSPAKLVAFVAAVLPALWIAYQAAADELGARPVTEAIHQAGDWALRFLLITLAITPAQHILNYPRIILARRTLGVACAGYAVLHFSLY